MRLREFFYDDNVEDSNVEKHGNTECCSFENVIESRKRNKIWMPPAGRDQALDLYIQIVKDDILKGIKKNGKMNVTVTEEQALKSLLNDQSIIIRPADKGSGIVVLDTQDYIQQVEEQLQDDTTYRRIHKDLA